MTGAANSTQKTDSAVLLSQSILSRCVEHDTENVNERLTFGPLSHC